MQIETDELVAFWNNDSVFSNWYQPVHIRYNDLDFTNSEALFIYLKAEVFGDEEIKAKVLANQDPKTVKALGREIKKFDEDIWLGHRYSCMYRACFFKFSQNSDIKDILMATGDKVLVEASPYDKIWGIGLPPNSLLIYDKANWRGLNLLGEVIMAVRDRLKYLGELGDKLRA